jgi:hypothetical protein
LRLLRLLRAKRGNLVTILGAIRGLGSNSGTGRLTMVALFHFDFSGHR